MVSRRQMLQLPLAALIPAGASAIATGCGPGDKVACGTFEVDATSALVSVYSAGRTRLTLLLEELASGERLRSEPLWFSPATGYTAAIDLGGLAPGESYGYWLENGAGPVSATYHFRTAPDPDSQADFSALIVADIDTNPRFSSGIFDAMAGEGCDFFVSLGDWPYADGLNRAEYHTRHRAARQLDGMQKLLLDAPGFAIYDDHEVRNDWDATTRFLEAERVRIGLEAWDQWFPLRVAPERRYRSWRWGALAELFLLDVRLYRSARDAVDGPDKTMLGAEQRAWLLDGLRASQAPFKIVFTPVPLTYGGSNDHWGSYTHERDLILDTIVAEGIETTLLISADQHFFGMYHYPNGLEEMQIGPVSRGVYETPPSGPERVAFAAEYNYGHLGFSVLDSRPQLEISSRGAKGQVLYSEILAGPARRDEGP